MRILHVVTYMGRGGLETMLMNYYRHIDKEQLQFDFLVHRDFEADYDQEIQDLGGKIYHLPRLNPVSLQYKRLLGSFFDTHREYKIIHVHQDCMSSVVLKVAKEHGVPIRIAHSHSSSQDKNIKYPIKLFFQQFIPKYSTHLMACGDSAGQWMFRGTPFQILNNAIDTSKYLYDPEKRYTVRKNLGITDNTILIGHVGRFSPPKNHSGLIDIFDEIRKRAPAKLLLVGDGKLREDIEHKVANLNCADDVIFAGMRLDVNELMQAMDVFVFPSLYEGVPLTIIEAQASGLPCLISDNVPIECKVTNPVQQISLQAGAASWATAAIEAARIPRKNTFKEIAEAGYDVTTNAEKLTKWYIDLEASIDE